MVVQAKPKGGKGKPKGRPRGGPKLGGGKAK